MKSGAATMRTAARYSTSIMPRIDASPLLPAAHLPYPVAGAEVAVGDETPDKGCRIKEKKNTECSKPAAQYAS